MSLILSEQRRNRPHRHIDIVRPRPVRERLQFAQNIIGILIHQRRHSNAIRHRTMTRLARRNPAPAVSKRNQMRCNAGMNRIGPRLRKIPVILQAGKNR
jgi:hypothetical protein